jgi:two-component system, OmpR family, sensor histidine kinase CiaH
MVKEMFKNKIFRRQQLKFMVLNLLSFTVIFTIFGLIIFGQVQNTLFTKTDEELRMIQERMDNESPNDSRIPPPNEKGARQNERPKNPRVMVIKWDYNDKIVNQDEIGTSFFEDYLEEYKPDKTNLNTITNTNVNNLYPFRYILFEDTHVDDEVSYIQLMINIDAEQNILNNFSKLLILCSSIFILLSISASYFLSKKMMKPIIHSWNKQAEFVENASHELRTPLTIIQNKLELMLTTPHEKIAEKFENIALSLSETRRLAKLTTDLLTLARADSAETQLEKKSINFDSFVRSVCSPYIEIAESQDKHLWLNLNSSLTIQADETRLHQLLVILLDNALKYTIEHDSIGVKTYEEDQKVVLEISDSGIGIKEENIPYIFDRFYREDKARTRESGGIGLGLSIAQWIVSAHDGSIKVSANENKGTTFKIKLPK